MTTRSLLTVSCSSAGITFLDRLCGLISKAPAPRLSRVQWGGRWLGHRKWLSCTRLHSCGSVASSATLT